MGALSWLGCVYSLVRPLGTFGFARQAFTNLRSLGDGFDRHGRLADWRTRLSIPVRSVTSRLLLLVAIPCWFMRTRELWQFHVTDHSWRYFSYARNDVQPQLFANIL